jgi:hypothetical protein
MAGASWVSRLLPRATASSRLNEVASCPCPAAVAQCWQLTSTSAASSTHYAQAADLVQSPNYPELVRRALATIEAPG